MADNSPAAGFCLDCVNAVHPYTIHVRGTEGRSMRDRFGFFHRKREGDNANERAFRGNYVSYPQWGHSITGSSSNGTDTVGATSSTTWIDEGAGNIIAPSYTLTAATSTTPRLTGIWHEPIAVHIHVPLAFCSWCEENVDVCECETPLQFCECGERVGS